MLGNFIYANPTKLYFGEDSKAHLAEAIKGFGNNVLLTYGGGSIKRNGIYDDVMAVLKDAGKNVVELPGVMPNPTLEKVMEGVKVARENNIDLILAVGGGSTIDYSKAVAVAANYEGDAWQTFWVEQQEPSVDAKILPVGAVLTMAGTGSEMNGGSVITNEPIKMKIGKVFDERVMPKFAILNPRYTFTVPYNQMVAGIFDTMSHIMEQYFSGDDDSTSDYLAEGLMRSVIASSKVAVKDPENYEARSNIMWSATWALNTLIGEGKTQDWMVHMIGHAISAFTHATHGMTLAGVSVAYYRHVMKYAVKRFARFAKVVWEIPVEGKTEEELANAGIDALAEWIKEIGAASNISSLGVTSDIIEGIANATIDLPGGYHHLSHEEIVEILKESL
ncbi:MAG: iron-containing alcohol dehydrogenase [Muribaculaceae bacterium]|nr:iron-containing alcohol dehydrogenase [Muribaculaceae bacterium]